MTAWRCPKCGAEWYKCGSGHECVDCYSDRVGLICECLEPDSANVQAQEDHGETAENPCPHAHCYHCGWKGTVPA